jgi:hypothetical protein
MSPDRLNKFYIIEWKFDGILSKIEMVLTLDPEIGKPDKIVIVGGVTDLSIHRYHDPLDVCYGNLEKLTVTKKEEYFLHYLDTGDAIIEFKASEEMII